MENRSKFIYITYIKSRPQRVWDAITKPELTSIFWQHENISDWKQGSEWMHIASDSRVIKLIGEVIRVVPNKLLTITWAAPSNIVDNSQVTFRIEPEGNATRLFIKHDNFIPGSKMLKGIKDGWPRVFSSMKTFLETGSPLITWNR